MAENFQMYFFVLKVVYLLLASILGPQFLGTLRKVVSDPPEWKDWRKVGVCILVIVFSPFHMYVEHIKLSYLEMKLELRPNDQSLISEKENLKRSLNMHVKLELGLETIYQLAGQLILLLLAYTETGTQNGLRAIFNEGLEPWPLFLLISSLFLSFYSCVTSHWKALIACREYFPIKSRMISGIYSFFGCLTRVTAIVMFFAGPLGLFDLLRHLQGEQYPWDTSILTLVGPDGTMVLGNNPPFKWNSVDRWKKAGPLYFEHENGTVILDDIGNPMPNPGHQVSAPDYTFYAGLRLRYYLVIFLASNGIQILVIFIAKSLLSKSFLYEFNFLEKVLHCLENSNIPYNAKEWDDGKGDAKEHQKRMRSNWFEVLAVIIINGICNSLLILSLGYTGSYDNRIKMMQIETIYFHYHFSF